MIDQRTMMIDQRRLINSRHSINQRSLIIMIPKP